MDEITLCPICLSHMDDENNIYKLNCNHSFHTDCIMNWFRKSKGNCPCCMDNPYLDKNVKLGYYYGSWNHMYINERFSTLKKQSRKKEFSTKVKNKIEKIKQKEEELNQLKKNKSQFLKSDKYKESVEIIKQKNKINTQIKNKENTILKIKTKIISDIPCIQNI